MPKLQERRSLPSPSETFASIITVSRYLLLIVPCGQNSDTTAVSHCSTPVRPTCYTLSFAIVPREKAIMFHAPGSIVPRGKTSCSQGLPTYLYYHGFTLFHSHFPFVPQSSENCSTLLEPHVPYRPILMFHTLQRNVPRSLPRLFHVFYLKRSNRRDGPQAAPDSVPGRR